MSEVMEHWLDKRVALSPDALAIETPEGEQWTFFRLQQEAKLFAKKLANVACKQKHIGILSGNSVEMVVAFLACTYIQAPVVFLNTRLTEKEIEKQCQAADVDLLLTSTYYRSKAKQLSTTSYTFNQIRELETMSISLPSSIKMEGLCSMMFTSGTTGTAKAVMHRYKNHWASAVASALNLGLLSTDKWLACLPLFHIGGLSIILKGIIYGMPVYLLERFDEQIVHQAIIDKGVSIVSVVSVTCMRLLQLLGKQRYPKNFRCMLLGGGPAPQPLLEKARALDVPIVQTFGMTETSSQIATLNEHDALRKIGSAGHALFSASLEIRKNGKQAAVNEIGEIVVRGPMVTDGYYKREEANLASFQEGWFLTGDLGYQDEEGFLYVVDRRSDLIISGGENIYPAEIEDCLLSMPTIAEAGVVGIPDPVWGEVPVAFVVKRDGALTQDDIVKHCRSRLARFKIPKQIFFTDVLPRNATNKLQRHQLKKWIEERNG
ncbi:o-succinylbenzoate--CoA ligase [Gracilibacillus dipsosauri]|uniref:2-succinylbenzoate--CoA ligase n=1 Tax=Gracilibacillus dipsosauri TaxID=178340 RepID=A0A317KXA9_9BACI|nr:o-succinylbenzoate--CoA ligase [Gracilibacillus dipsosauri]PWU68115.1 o-succinylbenzoate--CoA ligase [Gracilibacillus dipsosauri]